MTHYKVLLNPGKVSEKFHSRHRTSELAYLELQQIRDDDPDVDADVALVRDDGTITFEF